MVEASVREWHDDLGWGVVDSPETPGGCWVHFSTIRRPGFRTLADVQQVLLDFEPAHQDGFFYRATEVTLRSVEAALPETPDSPGAYSSELRVELRPEPGAARPSE